MELKEHFAGRIFSLISETADELGLECYVVGGYVRDIFLNRPSKDIDVVVVGSGIEMAQAFGKKLGRGQAAGKGADHRHRDARRRGSFASCDLAQREDSEKSREVRLSLGIGGRVSEQTRRGVGGASAGNFQR